MEYIQPNMASGFARNASQSLYPELWQNLCAYYSPGMGLQGNKLIDWSGQLNPGSFPSSGSIPTWVPGKNSYALSLGGNSTGIDLGVRPTQIGTAPQGITVSMWINSSTAQSQGCIFSIDENASLNGGNYYILLQASSGTIHLGGVNNGTGEQTVTLPFALTDSKWHHLLVTYNSTTAFLYLDGRLVSSFAAATPNTWGSTFHMWIAEQANVSSFVGLVGDVGVWNRYMHPSQVALLSSGASPIQFISAPTVFFDPNINVPVSILSVATSILSPTESGTANITPSILTFQTDVISPTSASVTVSIIASLQTVATSVLAPTIISSPTVTAALQTVATSILTPIIPQSITITPTLQSVATSQIAPSFVGESTTFSQFATKIVSINPLIFVTDTSPAKIAKVDTTIPTALTWQIVDLVGATNALSIAINTNTQFLYIACANGIVIKVELADITNQEIIDLGDVDDLETISALSDYSVIYTGTNNSIGELYLIDEREEVVGDLRLDVLAQITQFADIQFNIVETKAMNSNCEFIGKITTTINCDFKCLTYALDNITPMKRPDVHVFLDTVELGDTDLDLSSIQISHTIGNDSTATFNLTRKHDKLNTDLAGNVRTITNQNVIEIFLGDQIEPEFTGKISDIDCQYSENSDSITVTAIGDEKENLYNSVLLSLPGLQERLSLYHVMVNNPKISNPFIDPTKANPKKYKGILVDLGNKTVQSVGQYIVFDNTGSVANQIQAGTFNPLQNWTYFWSPTLTRFGNFNSLDQNLQNDAKIKPGPYDTPFSTWTSPISDFGLTSPNARVNSTNSPFFNLTSVQATNPNGTPKFDGDGHPVIISGATTDSVFYSYIGTSLSPVSEDLWIINNARHKLQRVRTDIVTRLGNGIVYAGYFDNITGYDSDSIYTAVQSAGYVDGAGNITDDFKLITNGNDLDLPYPSSIRNDIYTIINDNLGYTYGEAPFKKISVKSGIFIPKMRWEDREDGLYAVTDAGFDLTSYVQQVAVLEYQKLLNINGQILPDTSCQLSLTFDGYLYHGISLCSRVNIDNTTETNIFNGNNGFPVSIKGISIDTSTMKVSLSADNSKSTKELEAIDGLYPHDDDPVFNTEPTAQLLAQKSDLRTGLPVQ